MGYYTEIIFGAELKQDIPVEVVNGIQELVDGWIPGKIALRTWSYYFPLSKMQPVFELDDISKSYHLSFRSNMKNYKNEIENFINWIRPYVDSGSGERDFIAIVTNEDGEPKVHYKDTLKEE